MLAVHCSGSGKADLGWRVLHLDLRGVKFMSPMVLRGFFVSRERNMERMRAIRREKQVKYGKH